MHFLVAVFLSILATSNGQLKRRTLYVGVQCGFQYIHHSLAKEYYCCNERMVHMGSGSPADPASNTTNQCCCGVPYNSFRHACCDGVLIDRGNHALSACCGKKLYNRLTEICCCGKVRPKECGLACCGNTFYNILTHICCSGVVHKKGPLTRCCGIQTYNVATQKCCGGVVKSLAAFLHCCCDDISYHEGVIQKRNINGKPCTFCYKYTIYLACCGTNLYNTTSHICCGDVIMSRFFSCCRPRNIPFNRATQLCCNGHVLNKSYGSLTRCCFQEDCGSMENRIYYPNLRYPIGYQIPGIPRTYNYLKSRCCNGLVLNIGNGTARSCCGTRLYDYQRQICCGGKVIHDVPRIREYGCCGYNVINRTKQVCCCNKVLYHDFPSLVICCGGRLYRRNTGICCGDTFHLIISFHGFKRCCGNHLIMSPYTGCCNGAPYYSKSHACCSNKVIVKLTTHHLHPLHIIFQTCCGLVPYNFFTHMCCCGKLFNKRTYHACCGNQPYNVHKHVCCRASGQLYPRPRFDSCCHGVFPYNMAIKRCCFRRYLVSTTEHCTGQSAVISTPVLAGSP